MKFSLHTRHRSLLFATGEDARGLDNFDEDEDAPAGSDKQPVVAGPASADLTQSPGPGPDPRQEPYEERRQTGFGFTNKRG